MKLHTIHCPRCGHKNRNLDLRETKGWMECSSCLRTFIVLGHEPGNPIYKFKVPLCKPA